VRSRAQFKAHPIHPALIPFPFAFLTGALLFDVAGVLTGRSSLWTTGAYLTLAGIASGLIAAIPGLIDYLYTVPPRSSGRTRATRHALGNVSTLVLFGIAWTVRQNDWSPSGITLGLEAVAFVVLIYAGYQGGTLVTRNLISVDHRYANKGKWQEANFTAKPGDRLVVGHVDDLQDSQMKLLWINGRRIVLARTADGYTAFDDACTHRGGSLAGGVLIEGTVQCLWHGSQFDVTTGRVHCGPARTHIATHAVERSKEGQLSLVVPASVQPRR
jgi:uncharacterized membrane protein/nitrite reductase/ring-hydroxylating ferredoxin subunit